MEYTKDVFSNIFYKKMLHISNFKILTSKLNNFINENRTILMILSLLSILITIDIVLVNSFLELLSTLY